MCLIFRLLVVMKMFQCLEGKLFRCKIVTSQYNTFIIMNSILMGQLFPSLILMATKIFVCVTDQYLTGAKCSSA